MVALFFHFSKRINSTKRPDDADGTEMHVSVRGNIPSGQLSSQSGTEYFDSHPTIWVSGNSNYNYLKMGGRYYFVRDRQREINDATVYYLEEDYCATLKEDILNTTARVMYSSSNYDLNIDDARNIATESTSLDSRTIPFPFTMNLEGSFLVTIVGGNLLSTTYVMSPTNLRDFVKTKIYHDMIEVPNSDLNLQSINDRNTMLSAEQAASASTLDAINSVKKIFIEWAKSTANGFINQIGGAFESIQDIKWSPFDPAEHYRLGDLGAYEEVYLGTVDTGWTMPVAYGVTLLEDQETLDIEIPHQGSYYQKDSRFSSYGIYIPFCGQYALNNDDIYNESKLHISIGLDKQTGAIAGVVRAHSNNRRILSFSGQSARSIFYGTTDMSTPLSIAKNFAGGIISTITGAATGGAAGAAIEGARTVSHIVTGLAQTSVITGGSISSAVGVAAGRRIVCFSTMKGKADNFEAIKDTQGLPTYKTVRLGTLSGYCLCDHASVDTNGTLNEKVHVNRMLNSGFYIE